MDTINDKALYEQWVGQVLLTKNNGFKEVLKSGSNTIQSVSDAFVRAVADGEWDSADNALKNLIQQAVQLRTFSAFISGVEQHV